MSRNLWLKIIVIIIIQALLLTQADFALAAIYQTKDTFKEAALRFQKIATKSVSMIDGIGCVQLSLNSLHLPRLDLAGIFSLLAGSNQSILEIVSAKEVRSFNNGFYKALGYDFINVNNVTLNSSLYENIADVKEIMLRSRTEESTGPPTANAKLRDFSLNRIV
ncbi:MAG: hypothetical protein KAS13_04835 [Candidatus Omnitrophica bacterium]|nr:hypothetical protein [Candidatus Omnitrophota bacterium]